LILDMERCVELGVDLQFESEFDDLNGLLELGALAGKLWLRLGHLSVDAVLLRVHPLLGR
jgi:hypothetical protein